MSINSDILKYINTEKDLSKYQINILNKVKNPSLSQKRLMRIEHEFISLPLETIEFEDVADVATAISIYKTSRIQFYQTYNIKNTLKDTQLLLDIILNKLIS